MFSRSGCRANPCVEGVCGRGAECEDVGGRPVCKCLPGHHVSFFLSMVSGIKQNLFSWC